MNFIIDHWQIFVAIIVFIVGGVASVRKFLLQPSDKQIEQIKQWLLWAVTDAERYLGSGTGQLKLSFVYDLFLGAFPWLSKIISVTRFSELVDAALDKMRKLLESNDDVAALVVGGVQDE